MTFANGDTWILEKGHRVVFTTINDTHGGAATDKIQDHFKLNKTTKLSPGQTRHDVGYVQFAFKLLISILLISGTP